MSKTILLIFIFALILTGCSSKKAPDTTYIYKDVFIPVRCDVKLPSKPINDGSFEAHKKKIIYFTIVENLLMKCKGVEK